MWAATWLPLSADTFADAYNPAPPAFDWTRVNDDDSAVTYSSGAEVFTNADYFQGDMHTEHAVGESCRFSFSGTGVKWIGSRNNDHGSADVYLDGQFQTNVSSASPTWLKQQELFVKTGLAQGTHVLEIKLKTAGFQDVDAFEYQTPATPLPGPVNLGQMMLPAQVPYLNTKARYPLGNGVAMAVGEPTGEWTQLTGPGYTTPNFLTSEVLTLEIDGVERPLVLDMKRAEATGIYYGVAVVGDVQIHLIDFGVRGQPWLGRLVLLDNAATGTSHDVRLHVKVKPMTGGGMSNGLVEDAEGAREAVVIRANKIVEIPFGGRNIADKSVVIAFAPGHGTAFISGDTSIMESETLHLPPHGSREMALCHFFHEDDLSDSQCLAALKKKATVLDLEKSIGEWQTWFAQVPPGYKLEKVKEPRARRMLEGGLAVLKTNQSLDGGLVAHATFYKEGYIRDDVLGLRGLSATGHFDELKQWLIWAGHKFALVKHLPDAASCEASLNDPNNSFDYGNMDLEETALCLITARDYYRATQDLATLNAVAPMLQYCMDIQLKDAIASGYQLEFNGDETEICGAVNVAPSGVSMNDDARKNDLAMTSVALAAASLDFYIEYVHLRGDDPAHYKNLQTNTTLDLPAERGRLLQAMDANFWRTDVPEIPGGFHDSFRKKSDMSWPLKRIANLTLMPVYFGTPYAPDRQAKDVAAIASYFEEKTGFLQLVPGADTGFDGHDLGYLLWGLVETGNPKKEEVYRALVDGPTADCWGSFNEAYDAKGNRNGHDLRTFETGCNVSALAKYWGLK